MSAQDNQLTLVQVSEDEEPLTTVGEEIARIQNNIKEAHDLLATKGAKIPESDGDKTSENLANTINTLVGATIIYNDTKQRLSIAVKR
jgi:hypothetical protein